jgi:putative SOS response-associated peptidase YedK
MDRPELERICGIIRNKYPGEPLKSGKICPGDRAPVLVREGGPEERRAGVRLMCWGYYAFGKTVINARAETAAEKPLFRDSLRLRRCVIVSTGFYEWTHSGEKGKGRDKYLFRLPDTPVLYLAGFYELREGESATSY